MTQWSADWASPSTRKETSEYENGRAVGTTRPQHSPVNETPKARNARVGLASLLSQCSLRTDVSIEEQVNAGGGALVPEYKLPSLPISALNEMPTRSGLR